LKIGIMVNSAPPFPVAGAERQALEMARRLAERGHTVRVFARRFGGAAVTEEMDGYLLVRCPFIDLGPLRSPSQVASFLDLFRKHGRDLAVILSYQTFITGWLAALAKQLHGVPFVLWIRSQDEYQYTTRRKFTFAGRFVLPRADHVLVQSERVRLEFLEEVRRAFGPDLALQLEPKISIGPNAVEMISDRPSNGSELLFVGRLVELKDLSTLFRALRRLSHPPPTRIVGEGPMRSAWETEARGLPVTFTGRIEPSAVRNEYLKARAFVLLSREEGLPNVVLEALAAGVPVLSTPVAAVPDIVKDDRNGFLFGFGDDRALAQTIDRLWSDPALHERLARGALETARAFTWDHIVPEIEKLLERTASLRGRRAAL
jgi:glycosyltransferase involved in cell wall biosynthesis